MSETCTFEVESIKDTTLHASLRLCHPDEVFLWVSPAAIACLLQQLSERFGQKKTAQSLRKAGFFFDQEAGDEEELASLNLAATDFISSVRFGKVLHAREADARPGESLRLERDESGEDPEVKLVIRVKDARLLEGLEEGQRIDTVQSAMGPLPSEEAAKKPPAKPSTKKAKDTAVSIEGCGGRSDRVAITTDGSLVAIAAFGGPRVVVARTGDGSRASFELKAEVADVAFLGSDVVVAWRHKNTFGISIHDTTGKQLAKTKPVKIPSTGNVGRCVVSPNEELVAVSTSGEQTFLWKTAELRAGKPGRLFEVGAGGKAAPIGFSGSNEVLVALGENDLTQIEAITGAGKRSRTETSVEWSDEMTTAGDLVCLQGGSSLFTVLKKGKVLGVWKETFRLAAVAPGKLIGVAGTQVSIKRWTNWKGSTDVARASGFLGVVDLQRNVMSNVVPLNLKGANGMVFGLALCPGRFIAVGLDNEARLFPWSIAEA